MRKFRMLGAVALILSVIPAEAKTDLLQPFREVRIDPDTLASGAGKVYRPGDVVLRAFLRLPRATVVTEDRAITVNGFGVTLPKGTRLTEMSFIRAPDSRLFSNASSSGQSSQGAVFCNADRFNLGPFTSGDKLNPFKGLACLLDANLDGVFEGVTFIGFFSGREAGPVPIAPLTYQPVPGAFDPNEKVELIFKKFSGRNVQLDILLYTEGGKHSSFRMLTRERGSLLTDYERGCRAAFSAGSSRLSTLLGVDLTISDVDVAGLSFRGSFGPVAAPFSAYVNPVSGILDWIPNGVEPCGGAAVR